MVRLRLLEPDEDGEDIANGYGGESIINREDVPTVL